MSTSPLTDDGPDLQAHLVAAAGDVSSTAAIIARATAQGQRSLRRRRAVRTVGAGAGAAVLATVVVAGVVKTDPLTGPIMPAGPGTVRTVPDPDAVPPADTSFTVDPQVQQAATQAINAAATAAVPGLPPAQAEPTEVLNVPTSTGQRGWVWNTTDENTTPATTLFVSMYQYKKQPPMVVSICEGEDMAACTEEVLPDGSHLVSGLTRGTFDQDGVTADVTMPFATLTTPEGREVRALGTIGGLPQEGTTYPLDARITVEAARALVTASLDDLVLPTQAR